MLGALLIAGSPAIAQSGGVSLIRDAEIERIIRAYVEPIFDVAGLDPEAVRIHLVNDNALNAFVAGGQRIFIHTGLLLTADSPGQVIGVLAHETGHITGGHLTRFQGALRSARAESIAAMLLGAVAGLATGDAQAGIAVTALGQTAAQRGVLRYSRGQESAADAAALRFLDDAGISARGLLEFLRFLQRNEAQTVGRRNVYLSTHPLTGDRTAVVANHLLLSRYADTPWPADLVTAHGRMQAKLNGFLFDLDHVQRTYPDAHASIEARYAHAIVRFRRGELAPALELIDGLIAAEPNNPFFHELKGQMLFENARVSEAIAPYEAAVRLAPNEALLLTDLARVQIETGDPALLAPAKQHLNAAVRLEPRLRGAWRQLAIAHGRLDETGEMSLAMAESALIGGDYQEAIGLSERAEGLLPLGTPGSLRAQDIRAQAEREVD